MKMRTVVILICIFLCVKYSYSSESTHNVQNQKINRHELRLSYSDAIPLTVANFLGTGIVDAISNTNRTNSESWGFFQLGYRYSLQKWKVGGDFGFGCMTSDITSKNNTIPLVHQDDLNFLILPAGELSYYQKKHVNLYGSVSLGVMFTRTNYTSKKINKDHTISNMNKPERNFKGRTYLYNEYNNIIDSDYMSKFYSTFAFQINPIAIRVGNEHIGGFLELGVGYKGFLTAGISIQF